MARVALLIGSTRYEKGFPALPAVAENLRRLGEVLGHGEIGGFAVESLLDPDHGQMRIKLETWLRERDKDDVALLYLTGHGVKDRERKLYFAATDTRKPNEELITSTAVAAADLRSYLRQSRASKQIVILDCCFSGAFGDLVAMDDGSVDVGGALLGEAQSEIERPGRVVLTSSSSMEYSFVEEGASLSLYSQYLIEGLETGAADTNDDQAITADELYRYVSRKVTEVSPSMTPKIFVLKDEGYHVRIAKVPVGDPKVRYRKEVEVIIQEDEGEISFINRENLNLFRDELGLSDADAGEIERQVVEPVRQRRAKEKRYYSIFVQAIEHQYPLQERDKMALARLKKRLGLQTEDYEQIQQQVLADIQAKPKTESPETQSATFPKTPDLELANINELPLKTDNADYTELRNLLAAKRWSKADVETYKLMIEILKKKKGEALLHKDLRDFPCDDLHILDRLWEHYSKGKFGFTVQKRIWEKCCSLKPDNKSPSEQWEEFAVCVGWYEDEKWSSGFYDNLIFNGREGEFPCYPYGCSLEFGDNRTWILNRSGEILGIFSRIQTCEL